MLPPNQFFTLVEEQNKKNERPRIIKEYRPVKEYYPWRVLAIPAVFPVIGLFLFAKAAAEFSKEVRFTGGFYLTLALIFVGIGVLFAYPSKSDFSSCKRMRGARKTAENRGKRYHGTIQGYKVNVAGVVPPAKSGGAPAINLTYVLEVEYLEDNRYKTVETAELKYHPNAVLKGERCDVCVYEGEYFVCKFDLRTGLKDGAAEIPQKGVVDVQK
ncbi:MAG: hypothetical protein IJ427_02515 [Lachnospiraceae bacterium]|nr:hypothetical protein [Lachnospiraceae bacterium]